LPDKNFFLTFDGAPNPPNTDHLLDRLEKHGVKATFFMEGKRLEQEPECGRRVLAAGHAIGNHSYSHPDFSVLTAEEQIEELVRARRVLFKVLGVETPLIRPPFGILAGATEEQLRAAGYTLVLWDYSVKDREGPDAPSVADRVLGQLQEEATIVLHDHVGLNPDVLDIIISGIKDRGYNFCTKYPVLCFEGNVPCSVSMKTR
jgi:peptidoglycan/xylan/chitin deacetylase (PgdA/CDA1 family)